MFIFLKFFLALYVGILIKDGVCYNCQIPIRKQIHFFSQAKTDLQLVMGGIYRKWVCFRIRLSTTYNHFCVW